MSGSASKIKIASYNDLLMAADSVEVLEAVEIDLNDLYEPKEHPFKVVDDEKMDELMESIKENGVLIPGFARPRIKGGYELIAGNRRRRASKLAGKSTMPVIIRDFTDKEAIDIMCDTNIQRGDLDYSEKAFAYKMKYGAVKRQGQRTDLTSGPVDEKLENEGDSKRTIQRYICLTKLIKPILDLVDYKKLPFMAGVELSYLEEAEQVTLHQYMEENKTTPSVEQSETLHKYSKNKKFNYELLISIFKKEKKLKQVKVTLKSEQLETYFSEDYSKTEMEEIIYSLLEEWKRTNGKNADTKNEIQIPGQSNIENLEEGKYMPE